MKVQTMFMDMLPDPRSMLPSLSSTPPAVTLQKKKDPKKVRG